MTTQRLAETVTQALGKIGFGWGDEVYGGPATWHGNKASVGWPGRQGGGKERSRRAEDATLEGGVPIVTLRVQLTRLMASVFCGECAGELNKHSPIHAAGRLAHDTPLVALVGSVVLELLEAATAPLRRLLGQDQGEVGSAPCLESSPW